MFYDTIVDYQMRFPGRLRFVMGGLQLTEMVTFDDAQHLPLMQNLAPFETWGAVVKRVLLVCAFLSLLSACAVLTPRGSVIVDPDGGRSSGSFCPPGQAKKGNC